MENLKKLFIYGMAAGINVPAILENGACDYLPQECEKTEKNCEDCHIYKKIFFDYKE